MVPQKIENKVPSHPLLLKRGCEDYKKKDRKFVFIYIFILFFLTVLIMLRQLMSPAYFSCIIEDSYTYTSWAWQFKEALKEGIMYPRWLPMNFWGYGSPTFILYPPLAFYLVAFLNVFTHSIITAMNITKFMALFLSGVGMFFLIREFYTEKIALLTASFYVVFPYNIFQFYYVGTFASLVSLMWFAPILLFTYRYTKQGQYKNVLYAGACYSGLIMTHLINAYIFTFIIIMFTIFIFIVKKKPKALIVTPFVIIIGFFLSAVYVLPLIYEKQFVQIETFIGEGGGFDFKNFFIFPNMTAQFPPDRFWPVYYSKYIFFILFFGVLILLFFLQMLKLNHREHLRNTNYINKFFLCTAIGSLILLFGITTPIWKYVPFFKFIQFPHRWLNITTLAVSFLSAAFFMTLEITKGYREKYLFLVVLFSLSLLFDYKYINTAPFFSNHVLFPVKPANLNLEYLPKGVNVEEVFEHDNEKRISIEEGDVKAKIVAWESAKRIIDLVSETPFRIWIRTFNFPGWKAYIDGVKTEIRTDEDTGAMLINIPQGKHTLVLRFEDTPVRYYSKLISLISFSVLIILTLMYCIRSKKMSYEK